ncbi:MAG TPA: hypothetical protein VFV93_00275, partial [Thermomicrobiales bacterium]|nr:hypothetical protein [Thermomicrobiales bacterium]
MTSRNLAEVIDDLAEDARAGRLSRRGVLKRAMALGLSAPVVAGLLAACGGDDDDDDAAPANTAASGGSEPTSTTAADAEPTDTTASGSEGSATAEGSAEATEAPSEPTASEASAPPAQAGGGGLLRILQWQAPTILNPHLSTGYKDYDCSRIAYQPLADFNLAGDGQPFLAAEFPT